MENTIAVTTRDALERILAAQNSAAWSVNVRHWKGQLEYLLCVRKVGAERRAFLLCKGLRFVADKEATNRSRGKRPKFAIEFQEYVPLDGEKVHWTASQNPVRIEALTQLLPKRAIPKGVDFKKLGPKPPDAPRYSYSEEDGETNHAGLSVAEAKRGLAIRYEVPEEAIAITIRA